RRQPGHPTGRARRRSPWRWAGGTRCASPFSGALRTPPDAGLLPDLRWGTPSLLDHGDTGIPPAEPREGAGPGPNPREIPIGAMAPVLKDGVVDFHATSRAEA